MLFVYSSSTLIMTSKTSYTTSSAFNKLYISRKNLIELLEAQGYNAINYNNFSSNDVHTMAKNGQLDIFMTNDANGQRVYVKYYIIKDLRPQNIHDLIDEIFVLEELLQKGDQLLVVSKSKSNQTLKNEMEKIWANSSIYVNVLSIQELQFNILKHDMVPQHSKLNETQKKDFLTKYNIYKEERIPEISRFDPVAKAIGLQPSDVCRIIRPSRTAIEGVYYRLCVNK